PRRQSPELQAGHHEAAVRKSNAGLSSPFFFLGPADYVSHEGSRPISIMWRLRRPLPAKLYRRMARLAVG
ncbi:MAG TPA: hypothetical protein PLD59_13325, partial [Tepidisphaeraceae bacterium]|nr:hypothetical protein [Tepidisphaeraceae bacterium]